MTICPSRSALCVFLSMAAWGIAAAGQDEPLPAAAERPVDFVRGVEPILARHCYDCHGPDSQEGRLRLDAKALAFRGGVSGPAVVAGKSAESPLVRRLAGLDDQEGMPLGDDPLSNEEIGVIRAWIDQGAKWPDGVGAQVGSLEQHWAYVKPEQSPLPDVKNAAWAQNPIDAFILARLEAAGLAPSPPADRERLIRRVTLDLTGMPPTPDEIDGFLADESPDAYEKVVGRLLASPRYGERWAVPWLDAARYADSNGYQRDGRREYWAYRDWVIDALNADMPFDQFTVEQIAGDLLGTEVRGQTAGGRRQEADDSGQEAGVRDPSGLPLRRPQSPPGNPSTDNERPTTSHSIIATGFHRGTMANVEAGTDPEEQRILAVIDRVNTTGAVWLGTALECAQCHNHKYDPFTQKEYYRLFAFFNNTEGEIKSNGSTREFTGPAIPLPIPPEQQAELDQLKNEVEPLKREVARMTNQLKAEMPRWAEQVAAAVDGSCDGTTEVEVPENIRKILALAADERTNRQKQDLEQFFLSQSQPLTELQKRLKEMESAIDELSPPTTLVMKELAEPRMTQLLKRGDFLNPGEAVEPGTPSVLHPFPADAPPNRLGLARWLVDEENPLTARVTVNRQWTEFFGRGLVETPEDFGTQGEPPTHRELLDWLAVEFVTGRGPEVRRQEAGGRTQEAQGTAAQSDSTTDHSPLTTHHSPQTTNHGSQTTDNAWSLKHLHRLIVTSATYRQSSRITPELLRLDPYNALYTRGPRFRLPAEFIRDNALAISGLLSDKMQGPPVFPYQPPGVWNHIGRASNVWETSSGEDLYRRGLYVYWRRTVPYPSFVNFDAPTRETCTVRRSQSNTPLQALTLMNDPVYFEAATALAARILTETSAGAAPSGRAAWAFRLATSRRPSAAEIDILVGRYQTELDRYRDDPAAAKRLIAKWKQLPESDAAEFAAWIHVANVLLNLDEVITK